MKAHIRYDDIKLKTVPMMLDNRTFNISATLNAVEKIQNKFGSLDDAIDQIGDMAISTIKELILIFIDDAVERGDFEPKLAEGETSVGITAQKIGSCIGFSNIQYYSKCLMQAISGSLPETEPEASVDDEGNETVVTDEMLAALADMPDDPEPSKNSKAE